MASKITDQSAGVYAKAVQDQNNAQSRTDQANVAKEFLKALKEAAEQAMVEAQAAADAAAAALRRQQDKDATLQAQLATLTSDKIHTEAEYGEGVRVREAAAAALRKKQAEEAAAAAAAAAAARRRRWRRWRPDHGRLGAARQRVHQQQLRRAGGTVLRMLVLP